MDCSSSGADVLGGLSAGGRARFSDSGTLQGQRNNDQEDGCADLMK